MTSKSSGASSEPCTVLVFSSTGTFGSVALVRMALRAAASGILVEAIEVSSALEDFSADDGFALSASSEEEQAAKAVAALTAMRAAPSLVNFTFSPHVGWRDFAS